MLLSGIQTDHQRLTLKELLIPATPARLRRTAADKAKARGNDALQDFKKDSLRNTLNLAKVSAAI